MQPLLFLVFRCYELLCTFSTGWRIELLSWLQGLRFPFQLFLRSAKKSILALSAVLAAWIYSHTFYLLCLSSFPRCLCPV